MTERSKGKSILSFNWALFALFVILTFFSIAANSNANIRLSLTSAHFDSPPIAIQSAKSINIIDTPPTKTATELDSLTSKKLVDTTILSTDSLQFKLSKDTLAAPVNYHADDSAVVDVPAEKIYLYGKVSSIKYLDNDLSAPEIQYDQKTSLVKANLKKDSLGNVISFVSYKQGEFISVMDSITLNMKTQRGITKGTYTKQGEMYVYGEKIKKVNPKKVYYLIHSELKTLSKNFENELP